jgi:hypothetical protein
MIEYIYDNFSMPLPSPEAIYESRKHLYHPSEAPTPLQTALGRYSMQDFSALPTPGTAEASELIGTTKPERFALFAKAIFRAFYELPRLEDEQRAYPLAAYYPDDFPSIIDSWDLLRAKFKRTLHLEIDRAYDTSELTRLHHVNELVGYLGGPTFKDRREQLYAGVTTATLVNSRLLRSMPGLIRHFAPNQPTDTWCDIVLNSAGCSYMLSRRSVESLAVTQDILWPGDKHGPVDPNRFKPVFRTGGRLMAIRLNDIENQIVRKGYRPFEKFPSPSMDTPLREIAANQPPVIGCPITLLNGHSQMLWRWMTIKAVEQDLLAQRAS